MGRLTDVYRAENGVTAMRSMISEKLEASRDQDLFRVRVGVQFVCFCIFVLRFRTPQLRAVLTFCS
jgi:hypothetical protein